MNPLVLTGSLDQDVQAHEQVPHNDGTALRLKRLLGIGPSAGASSSQFVISLTQLRRLTMYQAFMRRLRSIK
jgi:hypothetical protein